MNLSLHVRLNGAPIGTLTLDPMADRYQLDYFPNAPFPVSPHLPFSGASSDTVKRFLHNLLPEGQGLEDLSIATQTSKANIFGLVQALGKETTGALTFHTTANEQVATHFREITTEELTERILARRERPITIWDGAPRLSVAGVQEKLPLLIMRDGRMGLGDGDLASTHILKFGNVPGQHLVLNESLCMSLAGRLGLPVAEATIVTIGEPVLAVRRFDRDWHVFFERIDRFHMIDGCQMLDLPPTYKYERPFHAPRDPHPIRAGASLPQLFASASLCVAPAVATRDILHWVLFNLLIENSDAHAKNISFMVGASGLTVAPMYDLLNLGMYGAEYDSSLAMAVGDTFDPAQIHPYQLAEMCEECKLPQRYVAKTLQEMAKRLIVTIDRFESTSLQGEDRSFAERLMQRIRANAVRYQEMARELPWVKL